jgi:hypothetical protein
MNKDGKHFLSEEVFCCNHCEKTGPVWSAFRQAFVRWDEPGVPEGNLDVKIWICAACDGVSIVADDINALGAVAKTAIVYPDTGALPAPPKVVSDEYRNDYIEASKVLPHSPKAAAAIARRILQLLLQKAAAVGEKRSLEEEIKAASPNLPVYLSSRLSAIREIGNFAAHPRKNTNTGEIINVDPGEAEYCLDCVSLLFDHFFVEPDKSERIKKRLNEKLKLAGKKEIS